MKIGPVGKHDARSTTIVNWDEGSHDGFISQIFLSHGVAGIMSIQFQFVMDGKLVLSDRHGPFSGNMFDVIELNYPHEYITGISGEYYKYEANNPHMRSLKFNTNTSEYGPFGTSSNLLLNSGNLLSSAVSMGLMMPRDYSTSVSISAQKQFYPK
uniref:Restricted tev movement 1 n=1 Tax=Arabidopsis thaliana TaxID=3702 RepID=D5K204_ARATH|nr:restricted tev movement 1 [Arabidopsis thaliana]